MNKTNPFQLYTMKNIVLRSAVLLFFCLILISMKGVNSGLQEKWEVPASYVNMNNPYADTDDQDRIGRITYSKYCKTCHGSKGQGDGSAAKLLETTVADFTSDEFKNQTDGSIYFKVKTGRAEMPGFEKSIPDDEDLWLLVNYIKNL